MENNWKEIVMAILALVSSGGWLNNYIHMKTIKTTQLKASEEAKAAKIDNDISRMNQLNKIIEAMDKRISSLEAEVAILRKKDQINEKKLDRKRKVIRAANKCKIPSDECPVLLLQEEFDKEEICKDCKKD